MNFLSFGRVKFMCVLAVVMSECGQPGMEMGDSFWELALPFHHRFQIWSLLQLSVHELLFVEPSYWPCKFLFFFQKGKKK